MNTKKQWGSLNKNKKFKAVLSTPKYHPIIREKMTLNVDRVVDTKLFMEIT